jgi:hypothetical protein
VPDPSSRRFRHPRLRTRHYRGCMTRRTSLRSQLYRAARDVGNVRAASRGPGSYAKRVARRKVYRTTNGMTRHLLRKVGL